MKASDLILRDREYAALLGNMEPDFGSDFGGGEDFDYPVADFGFDEDDDFGADAPSTAMTAASQASKMLQHPAHQARAHAIVAKHLHRQAIESRSTERLHPNKGNPTPTYRWGFSINGTITAIGTSQTTLGGAAGLSAAPNIGVFTVDTLTTNVPSPGMVLIQDIKVLSQSLLVGGASDAYKYAPVSTSKRLNAVPLNPAIPVVILATYSGLPIPGVTFTGAFTLDFNFEGWSSPVGMPVAVAQ